MNFTLAEPICFASSKETAGLQLVDVMAALIADLMTKRRRGLNAPLLMKALQKGAIDPSCISPDHTCVEAGNPTAKRNLLLLDEIFAASTRGEPIRDSLRELAEKVERKLSSLPSS